MKIFGIGTDIVNIKRISKSLKKNNIFKNKIFSKKEISYCEKKKNSSAFYAKRFAAKEAFSKALGTGIRKGVNLKNIEMHLAPAIHLFHEMLGGYPNDLRLKMVQFLYIINHQSFYHKNLNLYKQTFFKKVFRVFVLYSSRYVQKSVFYVYSIYVWGVG